RVSGRRPFGARQGKRRCGIEVGDADVGLDCDRVGLVCGPLIDCGVCSGSNPRNDWPRNLRALRDRRLGDLAANSRGERGQGETAGKGRRAEAGERDAPQVERYKGPPPVTPVNYSIVISGRPWNCAWTPNS